MRSFLVALGLLLSGPLLADTFGGEYQAIIDAKGKSNETERLNKLFEVDWRYGYTVYPETATDLGVSGLNDKWTDWSLAAVADRRNLIKRPLDVLATIDRAQLSKTDQLNFDLFKRKSEEAVEGSRFPLEYLQISQLDGVHRDVAEAFEAMPTRNLADLKDHLARLKALPVLIDQVIVLLSEGLKIGLTPPQIVLSGVPAQVHNLIPDNPLDSPLLVGVKGTAVSDEAVAIYKSMAKPALARLERFLSDTYVPKARTSIAATDLPNGKALYAWWVKTETTTTLTPDEIHKIGLAEVKRIHAEMEAVMRQTGFKGSMTEFFHFLQNDPRFFYTRKEDLLQGYRDIAKRADPALMKLFKTLPRTTYGVIEIPAYSEKEQTTAYYAPGSVLAGRPGYFYANTYALNTRPTWEMQPLTLHEAVPGHHLQIMLAQEMGALPDFRRYKLVTAFVEGWGLYAETLGYEMGFYTDPYDHFGALTYQMWRAVRLVVDTGMHAKGWTRQQAIDYFKANSSKPEHDIVVEIDRYLVWPGQALAYKLGQLKIAELRLYAERELKDKFDVRLFHDEVLKNGAIPLSVLEENIKAWVERER